MATVIGYLANAYLIGKIIQSVSYVFCYLHQSRFFVIIATGVFVCLYFVYSTPEGRAVSVTRELDLSLLCRIWLFGRHLVSLAKIAEVWPPFFLATETPDIALEYTSREILRPLSMSFNELFSRDH